MKTLFTARLRALNYERAIVPNELKLGGTTSLRALNYERAIVLETIYQNRTISLRALNYERAIVPQASQMLFTAKSQSPQLREGYCT